MPNEENKNKPPYVPMPYKYFKFIDKMSDSQSGKLLKYIYKHVNGDDSNQPQGGIVDLIVEDMICDIDRMLKSWVIKSQNGKKGGAPKDNKNACKSRKKENNELTTLFVDSLIYDLCDRMDSIYSECDKTKFQINQFYTKLKIAELATCYLLSDYYEFNEFGFVDYKTLKDATLNTSASTVCRMLKECAQEDFDYEDYLKKHKDIPILNNEEQSFSTVFADCKERTLKLLNLSDSEFKHFSDKCTAIYDPDFITKKQLEKEFTPEELQEINQAKNNLKSS